MTDPALADRPKAKSLRPLAALWPFLRPYRTVLGAAMLALLLTPVAMLEPPIAHNVLRDKVMAAVTADGFNIHFVPVLVFPVPLGGLFPLRFSLDTFAS